MGQLLYLNLSSNQISSLSSRVFHALGKLYTLELSDNKITKLSNRVFDGMSRLKYLNLRSNEIAVIPNGVFHGMGQLIELDLSDNQIAELLTGVFDGLGQLYVINLSNNKIVSIGTEVFSSILNIQIFYLYLDDNQLTTLKPCWYGLNVTTKHMNIGKNPWDCSCDNKWMPGWLNSIVGRIEDLSDVVCYTPPRLHNKVIIETSGEEFCVDPAAEAAKRAWTISMSSVAGVVIVLLSVSVIVYRLRVKLYTRFKFHPFDRDECLGEDMDYDVFLCCSSEDHEPEGRRALETMEAKGYRVCYHYRDFMPGLIVENIEASVTRSKRTLCLLTRNFVRRFAIRFLVSLVFLFLVSRLSLSTRLAQQRIWCSFTKTRYINPLLLLLLFCVACCM